MIMILKYFGGPSSTGKNIYFLSDKIRPKQLNFLNSIKEKSYNMSCSWLGLSNG